MQGTGSHIISKFRWDTSFDQKERASELQERLSGWSRMNMQKEIAAIFDKVCPPEQTWRIDLLELNFGTVSFNDLEFELALKLRQLLNEILVDLVIHANKTGRSNIEILNEDASHISVLRSFLLEGIMPWNYKPAGGSVNEMIAYQLQHNRQQLVAMLREVGATHENIRKRMAWQINEAGIVKIIEGLEPNNHSQIIDFAAGMTKVQMKETVVQASTADFKKNLWLWILNYLLTERGTIFSKVAFMRSSIRQMAAHYNITYEELFEVIERAVDAVNKTTGIKSDFVLTLKLLSKENHSKNKLLSAREAPAAYRERLKVLMGSRSLRGSAVLKNELNELVTGLFKQDQQAFRELVLSLGTSKVIWSQLISDLNDASVETLMAALSPTNATAIIEHVYFLHRLGRKSSPAIKRKTLWKIAIAFLLEQKNSSFSNSLFLNYCMVSLSKKNQVLKPYLLDQLMNAVLGASAKTVKALDLYRELHVAFTAEITGRENDFFNANLEGLLQALAKQINAQHNDKEMITSLKRSVVRHLQLQPALSLAVLQEYKDKALLRRLLPQLLNEYTAQLLLKQMKNSYARVLPVIQQVLKELKEVEKAGALATTITESLFIAAAAIFILQPQVTPLRFLEQLLEALFENAAAEKAQFSVFTELLLRDEKLSALGISPSMAVAVRKKYTSSSTATMAERVQLLRMASENKQWETLKELKNNFSAKELAELKTLNKQQQEIVLECLLTDGKKIMEAQVKEYAGHLSAALKHLPAKEIIEMLSGLYWKCVLSYKDHRGNPEALKRSFRKAVLYKFSLTEKQVLTMNAQNSAVYFVDKTAKNKAYRLKNGIEIQAGVLQQLIREAVLSDAEHVDYNGTIIRLSELIMIARNENIEIDFSNASGKNAIVKDSMYRLENGKTIPGEWLLKLLEHSRVANSETVEYKGVKLQTGEWIKLVQEQNEATPMISHPVKGDMYRLKNGVQLSASMMFTLIRQSFETGVEVITHEHLEIRLKEVIRLVLEKDPAALHSILAATATHKAQQLKMLKAAVAFDVFVLRILQDVPAASKETFQSMQVLQQLFTHMASAAVAKKVGNNCWALALELIASGKSAAVEELKKIIQTALQQLQSEQEINVPFILSLMKDHNIRLTPQLQKIMTELIPALAMQEEEALLKTTAAGLQKAEDSHLLAALALHIITHKEIPVWFENATEQTAATVLNTLVLHSPLTFLDVIKQEMITEAQFSWLHRELDFKSLMVAAGRLNKNKTALLTIYEKLYLQLGKIAVKGIAASEIQYLLFRKLLKAWTSGNWRIVSTEQIWNELTWDVCVKRGVSKKDLLQGIEKIKMQLPLAMQVALEQLKDRERAALTSVEKVILPKPAALLKTSSIKIAKGGIPVKNAGIVLISSYIEMLLERLGITDSKKFKEEEAKTNAPHYLQYVVTGLSATDESLLPLNKVLCGIPLSEPLREGINITDEHKKLINGLLTAMIGYWPAIGNCSTDGFRGNWLVREGLLLEHDDKWELTVEKRAYDVLIHQSPFAFSIIKLPWMSKPLHVTWPY